MPVTPVARNKIDAIGIDQITDWISDGKGLRWIADQIGTTAMSVSRWVNADPLRSARVTEAQIVGADAFEHEAVGHLERAEQAIRDDPQIASAIVALARERAQACWRQASVRDPRRYSDKRGDTYNIDARKAVQSVTIIGVPPRGDGGVHRIAATGGSQQVGVLPSNLSSSEIENAVFPARAEKSVSDLLVSTSKYRRKVVDE
jgi:hypothetical protein